MKTNFETLATFVFKEYPTKIKLSNKQRPKYFYANKDTLEIKGKGKKPWKRLFLKEHKDKQHKFPSYLKIQYSVGVFYNNKFVGIFADYVLRDSKLLGIRNKNNIEFLPTQFLPNTKKFYEAFNKGKDNNKVKYYVINNKTGEKVVSNPSQEGTAKYQIIKGQDFYSGFDHFSMRNKVVEELKKYYYNNIDKNVNFLSKLPIRLSITLYDTLDNERQINKAEGSKFDVGNKVYPYMKTFSDFISQDYKDFKKIIEDDDKLNIFSEEANFLPILNKEDRKMVVKLKYSPEVDKKFKEVIEKRKQNGKIII